MSATAARNNLSTEQTHTASRQMNVDVSSCSSLCTASQLSNSRGASAVRALFSDSHSETRLYAEVKQTPWTHSFGRGVTDTQTHRDVCVNRFIWFTDLYIFPSIHPQEHHISVLKEYPLTSRTLHVYWPLKIKITSVFCFFSSAQHEFIYTRLLYDKKHFLETSLQWLLTYIYNRLKDGLVLNQMNFGKVKLGSWLVWSEPKFQLMTDDDMPAPRGRAVDGARLWLKEIPDH